MQIRRKVSFTVSVNKEGVCRVRARVSMPRQGRVDIRLYSTVAGGEWDKSACRFIGDGKDAGRANEEIDDFKRTVSEVFARYELVEKRAPTLAEVKADIEEATGRMSSDVPALLFRDVFRQFLGGQGERQWTDGTARDLNSFSKRVLDFRPDLTMNDITDDFLRDYVHWLIYDLGYKNLSTHNHTILWRWFLRWAWREGYYSGRSHETFRPRLKGINANAREVIYCTLDEVRRIEGVELTKESMRTARDKFIFCCFTGLRYSDMTKLRRCDIHGDTISVVAQKTTRALTIELNRHAKAILDRYISTPATPDARVFPYTTLNILNMYIREVARLAGVDAPTKVVEYSRGGRTEIFKPKYEVLTSHCARRTFVVTALQLGIPAEVIMRWTGHSSYEAMKPYIAIVDGLKRSSMERFDNV